MPGTQPTRLRPRQHRALFCRWLWVELSETSAQPRCLLHARRGCPESIFLPQGQVRRAHILTSADVHVYEKRADLGCLAMRFSARIAHALPLQPARRAAMELGLPTGPTRMCCMVHWWLARTAMTASLTIVTRSSTRRSPSTPMLRSQALWQGLRKHLLTYGLCRAHDSWRTSPGQRRHRGCRVVCMLCAANSNRVFVAGLASCCLGLLKLGGYVAILASRRQRLSLRCRCKVHMFRRACMLHGGTNFE